MRYLVLILVAGGGLCSGQTAPGGKSGDDFVYRWNGYGFFASGGTVMEGGQPGFRGGGGGFEGFLWKGITAGADVSALYEKYLNAGHTSGHLGANLGYPFASRTKQRGMAPFVLFGVGEFFPNEPQAVVHGGAGFNYWIRRHVAVRIEFRVGARELRDDVVGTFRAGVSFR